MKHYLSFLFIALTVLTSSNVYSQVAPVAKTQNFALADNSDFQMSSYASLGYLNGTAWETVYNTSGDGRKLSELVWDIKDVYMLGMHFDTKYQKNWRLSFSAWTNLSEGSGGMTDTDWLLIADPTYWTHFSNHNVQVKQAHMLDIEADYLFYTWEDYAVDFRAGLGFKYRSWKWEDSIQYLIYSSDPDGGGLRDVFAVFNGERGIDYTQWFYIPYIGLSMEVPTKYCDIDAYIQYTYLASGKDHDYHIQRDTHFDEAANGGSFLGYGIHLNRDLQDDWFLTAALDFENLREIRGDTRINGGDPIEDSAGMFYNSYMASIAFGKVF